MAKPDALAQLKDIHLPSPIHWWPLAPGWYVLIIGCVLMVMGFIHSAHRRHLNARPKKQALILLVHYITEYEQEKDSQMTSARISELLRRVALAYYPRADVASLSGEAWIAFLNKTSHGIEFTPVKSMLLESPFKSSEPINLKPLILRAQAWIKQRSVPCLK